MPTNSYKLYGTETQMGSTYRKAYFVGVDLSVQLSVDLSNIIK